MVVVLPAPLAPIKPVRTPGRTVNPTSSRASTGPYRRGGARGGGVTPGRRGAGPGPYGRVRARGSGMGPTLRSPAGARRPPRVGLPVPRQDDNDRVALLLLPPPFPADHAIPVDHASSG